MTVRSQPSPAPAGAQARGRSPAGSPPDLARDWAPAFAGEAGEQGFTPVRRSAEHGFIFAGRSAEHGFTLVEVMVALLVFSILAVAGVSLLSFSVRAQGAAGRKLDDLGQLNRTLSIMAADLGETMARQTRDEAGTPLPAFVGRSSGEAAPMLRLVRGGWTNLDAAPRPDVQKVAYQVSGGTLERLAWPQLDGAAPLPPAPLLDHVRAVRLRYRFRGAWTDRWDGANGVPLPQLLEMTVQRDTGVTYRQLFLVGTDYALPPPPPANAAP